MKAGPVEGPEIIEPHVSRETLARLEAFVALLKRWQKAQNLISSGDLEHIWRRHVLDSLQLVLLFPEAVRWLDLGSGAGFPGLVTAIALANRSAASVTLVESNQGKCAFLRAAIRETGAPAKVLCDRIDSAVKQWSAPVDLISARALAPLVDLCAMVGPLLGERTRAVFHKGRDFDTEFEEASKSWAIDLIKYPSMVSSDGIIVEMRHLTRREDRTA